LLAGLASRLFCSQVLLPSTVVVLVLVVVIEVVFGGKWVF
jgi:hypothetical protein